MQFPDVMLFKLIQFIWFAVTSNFFFECIIAIFFNGAFQYFIMTMIAYHSIMNVDRFSNVLGNATKRPKVYAASFHIE